MIDKKQPIIVKKVSHGGHGHHGGAWKVAMADFAVAMMAFFMLMWLVAGTSEEEKAAISQYFENPSMAEGVAPTSAPSSVNGPGGASTGLIRLSDVMADKNFDKQKDEDFKEKVDDEEQKRNKEEQQEKKMLDDLMADLKKVVEESDALAPYKDQLLIDITPEGMRIQIVDKANRPMFESGKADLMYYTVDILFELAKFIRDVPNRISLTGHTDASQFTGREGYSNWELSADRANAARRALVDGGVAEKQVGRVVGLASSTLFDKADPLNPINRRISLLIMNKKTDEAIERGEGVMDQALTDRDKAQEGGFDDVPTNVIGAGDVNIDMDEGTGEATDDGESVSEPGSSESKKPADASPDKKLIEMPKLDAIKLDKKFIEIPKPDVIKPDKKANEAVGERPGFEPREDQDDDFEELPMEFL